MRAVSLRMQRFGFGFPAEGLMCRFLYEVHGLTLIKSLLGGSWVAISGVVSRVAF